MKASTASSGRGSVWVLCRTSDIPCRARQRAVSRGFFTHTLTARLSRTTKPCQSRRGSSPLSRASDAVKKLQIRHTRPRFRLASGQMGYVQNRAREQAEHVRIRSAPKPKPRPPGLGGCRCPKKSPPNRDPAHASAVFPAPERTQKRAATPVLRASRPGLRKRPTTRK
jgi:hypothetical protein